MFWLIVERRENWEADFTSGFSLFGIPESKLGLASKINKGDILISYISSGISCFSDVRRVVSDKLQKTANKFMYDEPYPYYISTESVHYLPIENWIKVHDVIDKLGLTRNRKDWRQLFRASLRQLSDEDGIFLMDLIAGQSKLTNKGL